MRRGSPAVAMVLLFGLLPFAGSPAAAQEPSLSILSPQEGAIIGDGAPVIVTFAVSNVALVQPGRVGQGSGTSEGHVDLYVDGAHVRLLTRVEPVSLDLPSGPHTIRLQLMANNRTPLAADVSVRIVSTEGPAAGTPTIRILSPAPEETTGHDVYVTLEVTNFALVDPRGQPNAPGEGHVQMSLNGVFQQVPRRHEPGFFVDLPDGENTITARLVNNDGTPLDPEVSTNVTFHIEGAPDPTPSAALTGGISGMLAAILIVLLFRRRKAAARLAKGFTSDRE